MGSIKFGNLDIEKIYFGADEVAQLFLGDEEVYSAEPEIVVDPVLANNSWETIKDVCDASEAANYWAVGDTKTDLGTDNYTRTFRIVDMSGLYGKNVVFEQVGLEGTDGTGSTGISWDAEYTNDYAASDMNVTVLPSVLTRYSSELQSVINNTTVKVAENGGSSTIVNVTNKLFLEAEKEVGSTSYSRLDEKEALTTYGYYVTHNTNSSRIKYNQANTACIWYLRSPQNQSSMNVCLVSTSGGVSYTLPTSTFFIAPCFALGVAPIVVSTTLNDNSWDVIKSVCESGEASNYWAVGDTKTDTGTDNYTRTFRIVDMSGLYGKNVVFEQVGLEGTDGTGSTGISWDADNSNDYAASDMNTTILPSVVLRYSSELQQNLTNTTVKVAENGNSSTIVNVTNKLFLEAEKEVGLTTYSRSEEQAVLTTYAYYVSNQNINRIKYREKNNASTWWLRSASASNFNSICFISSDGNEGTYSAFNTRRFAPCFSF